MFYTTVLHGDACQLLVSSIVVILTLTFTALHNCVIQYKPRTCRTFTNSLDMVDNTLKGNNQTCVSACAGLSAMVHQADSAAQS